MQARLLVLLILAAGSLAACPSTQSAPLPKVGDCISELEAYGGERLDHPRGRTLHGYAVRPCDAAGAEYRVAEVLAGDLGEPPPCDLRRLQVMIELQSEPARRVWNICLVRVR